MASWPKPSDGELNWYVARKEKDLDRWRSVGIAETLELCFSLGNGGGNRAPLVAALCFWDTSSNTFNFKFGQMGITLLDILTITGLPIHPAAYCFGGLDHTADTLEFKPSKVRAPFNKSYTAWTNRFSLLETEEGGIAFLELWFCKYIFCNSAHKITGTWTALAENLFNRQPIGLGQPVLASLYRALYSLSLRPFDFNNIVGPLWILDLWLQIYFPQFRHPDVDNFPEDQVLGIAFANRTKFDSPTYIECFKCLYHLDDSALDSAALILSRKFPSPLECGFLLSATHSRNAAEAFMRAISCYDFGLSEELHGFELYAPNHFARQLGFKQEIPLPLINSLNRYCSWRIKAGAITTGDEADRYTVRFKLNYQQLPPPVSCIERSQRISAAYKVWWSQVSAGYWDRDAEHIFRSIFANGITLLGFAEDQRVLKNGPTPEYTGKQSLAKKGKAKAQVYRIFLS